MKKETFYKIWSFLIGISILGNTSFLLAQKGKTPTTQKSSITSSAVTLDFPSKPSYPNALSTAIKTFDANMAPYLQSVKEAKDIFDQKYKELQRQADSSMLKQLEADYNKARNTRAAISKELEDFLAAYKPEQTNWNDAPTDRLKKNWLQYQRKISTQTKKEETLLTLRKKTVANKCAIYSKPVLKQFDFAIKDAAKSDNPKLKQAFEKEKEEFISSLQRYDYNPDLLLLLTFNRDTVFKKDGQFFAEDLSGREHHCKLIKGKLVPSPKGGAFSTSTPGQGGCIPSNPDFLLDAPEGSTLIIWLELPPKKLQKNRWFNCFAQYGSWCIASPGVSANSLMAGYSIDGGYWFEKKNLSGWHSLVWMNDPKTQKQYFWIDGRLHPKTKRYKLVKPGSQLEINRDIIGSIDELRLYRGILSARKIQQILK